MISRRFALICLLAGLAGCNKPLAGEEVKAPPSRPPAQLCSQASEGIKKLTETGGFQYSGAGEGTLEEEAWLRMSELQRDQLLNLLAVDASCTAEQPVAESTARVRNEGGRVLSERVVETSGNLADLDRE